MHVQGPQFDQLAKSVQALNNLNQKIVDSHQEISGKLLGMTVSEKVGAQKLSSQAQAIDYLA